jgi:hypothetical protein
MTSIEAWGASRGLDVSAERGLRELTPALIQGTRGSVSSLIHGRLGDGLDGTLCHHTFADGRRRRESTVVVTAVPEGAAFAPALVCRDRGELGNGLPAQLPAERWHGTVLESTVFNRRYRLLTLAGQDPIYVRELFSPSLIAWLAHDVPVGFSFELNERHLVIALPGHLEAPEDLDRLCALAAEVTRRIRAEALEEGEGTARFDESEKRLEIEAAMAKARFDSPPASVAEAMAAYRRGAYWRPTVVLSALLGAAIMMVVGAAAVALFYDPLLAPIGALVGAPNGFGIGRLMAASRYSWGSVSVSRLGLEAFVSGYAESRSMQPRDRWEFHSRHRTLPLPGFAGHVLAGPIPGTELDSFLVMLGDAAELRSRGQEIAYTSDRPLAALALVTDLSGPADPERLAALELPETFRVEADGDSVAIWKPMAGNLVHTAAGLDEFHARAGALLAQVGEHREDPAMAAVPA